jgi:hypothetical protein
MANGRGKSEQPIDHELVANYVEQLSDAKTQRAAFDRIFAEIKTDSRLKAPDIIAIAQRYNGGGKKPSSKTMALAAISKRFVEIVRFHAKNKVAEKVRPW